VSNVDLCVLVSCEAGVHEYKVGRLGEAINNIRCGQSEVSPQ
jgi:hypothetical protein